MPGLIMHEVWLSLYVGICVCMFTWVFISESMSVGVFAGCAHVCLCACATWFVEDTFTYICTCQSCRIIATLLPNSVVNMEYILTSSLFVFLSVYMHLCASVCVHACMKSHVNSCVIIWCVFDSVYVRVWLSCMGLQLLCNGVQWESVLQRLPRSACVHVWPGWHPRASLVLQLAHSRTHQQSCLFLKSPASQHSFPCLNAGAN